MTEYKETAMFNKKVFISFDYDNDKDIKENLVAQTRQSFCSYEIRDESIKAPIDSKWREEARQRIKNCDVVIVLCGEHTDTASGVAAELTIAQEENIPYFLLQGRRCKECKKPNHAKRSDEIHPWTWNTIDSLLKRLESPFFL